MEGQKIIFKDMATYIDPYSITSIRSGIETTLNQELDNKLRDYIKNNFLWEKVADLTANIYRQILGQ